MTRYLNYSHKSGVQAYEIGDDCIQVQFTDGAVYTYTHARPGKAKVEQMKKLAASGKGLCTYISQHVGRNYASKD